MKNGADTKMSLHERLHSRHIAWEQLQARISEGIPFVHRVPAPNPSLCSIDIRVAENGTELSMWVPCERRDELVVSPLVEIDISSIQTQSGSYIEIKTTLPILFQEIYSFFVSVIDKIQLNQLSPYIAIDETLEGWRELLEKRTILSEEAQVGLRGELHVLRLLISVIGDDALLAWIGPQNQPHDFRLKNIELEVKATCGAIHAHIINGLGQLEPSPAHRLYVFSLRLTLAGAKAGSTLCDDIELTKRAFSLAWQWKFERIVREKFGYRKEHASLYTSRLQVADKACLIPVDASCPRLSVPLLSSIPHRGSLSDFRYRVNFEGLGFSEGSHEFDAIILSACQDQKPIGML